VKDRVSGDLDTLISVEKIRGSQGSDAVYIETLSSPRLSGIGGSGALNGLDFGSTKANGEVDKLDLSAITVPLLLNLSSSQVTVQDRFSSDNPDPATQTINIDANFLGEHAGNGSNKTISVSGFNYIIGSNSYGTLADGDPISRCDDLIIGSSLPEIFEQTSGFDKIHCGNGDVLFNPHLANMSYFDYWNNGPNGDFILGSKTIIHFNGIEIDAVFAWPDIADTNPDPTGTHEVGTLANIPPGSNLNPLSRTPITLSYDASTMTAILTDTRDGSTMTLDNWDPYYTYTSSFNETFDQYAALWGSSPSGVPQIFGSPEAQWTSPEVAAFDMPWAAHITHFDALL